MSVLKQYNTGTSTWETIVVGQQGEPGVETGSVAPTNTSVLWMDTADAGSQVAVPSGGNPGQVLAKTSATDYATAWTDTLGQGNAIINGGFDVWQRGTSFTATGTSKIYTADHVITWVAGTTVNFTTSRQAFTPGSAPVAGYEGQYYLRQNTTALAGQNINALVFPVEDVRTYAGQTVTASFWLKADSARTLALRSYQVFTAGGSNEAAITVATFTATTSWQRFTATFTYPSIAGRTIDSTSYAGLILDLPANMASTIDVWGVQLEAGSYATPFKRAGGTAQGELAACQRYFVRFSSPESYSYLGGHGYASGATQAKIMVSLPTEMRTMPSSSGYSANIMLWDGASVTGVSSIGMEWRNTKCVQIIANTASGITTGKPYSLHANNSTASYIEFNAEL